MDSSSFVLGTTFKFDTIVYEIDFIKASPTYYRCKQISNDNEWPLNIYLAPDQLKHIKSFSQPLKQRYNIGTIFMMETRKYEINTINKEYGYYECIDIIDKARIYLSLNQLSFVNIMDDDDDAKEMERIQSLENISTHLPYFTDWMLRREKSVLNNDDFKDDPSGYLVAIRDKYNIKHRRKLMINDNDDNDDNDLRPWIEGEMEKLMAKSGYFGNSKWKTRLFRLFDEALVWFDNDTWFKRKRKKSDDREYIKPFGVLPLAMITGLKPASMNGDISEDELLRLELQIGDEGIIILKCHDVNQRIKWYECLHTAIFTVKRPLFVKDKDLWRISEPKPETPNTQLTKSHFKKKPLHVKMGKSLAFKLNKSNLFSQSTPIPNTPSNEQKDYSDIVNNIDHNTVPSTSNADDNVKIL